MIAMRYHESKQRGSADFPLDYHAISQQDKRYQMPYHWHEEYEFLRVKTGKFTLSCDENVYELLPGDAVLIAAGQLHGGEPENCEYECVVFDMRFMLKSMESARHMVGEILNHTVKVQTFFEEQSIVAREILSPMFEALRNRKTGYELITLGCLYRFVGEVFEKGLYQECPQTSGRDSKRVLQLKNVFELIEQNYAHSLTLQQLSQAAGMTPKYFCRFFKTVTHRTPVDYLNFYRIEAACVLMAKEEDTSVTRVALETGFSDVNYFIRAFRKYKGVTPGKYMKRLHPED